MKGFSHIIIEVIITPISYCSIIFFSKIFNPFPLGGRVILASYMVRDYVYNDFHPLPMDTLHQSDKLLQTLVWILRQVWIHIVIILHCIGGSCSPLDQIGIVMSNPYSSIVAHQGMM